MTRTKAQPFTVEQAEYHRNGVGGEGFYVGIVRCILPGYDEEHRLLITFFPHEHLGTPCPAGKMVEDGKRVYANGRVAVLSLDRLEEYGVAFGPNSWRGDSFYDHADAIVAEVNSRY